MKVLITGATGTLGKALCKELEKRKTLYIGCNSKTMDVRDSDRVFDILEKEKPDVLIHCAAYTNVDKAESEKELCFAVNVEGTRNVAMACEAQGVHMIYISTDYVFDGRKSQPYEVEDYIRPVNYYGYTKYLGEDALIKREGLHFSFAIVRTSCLYDHQAGFPAKILELAKDRDELRVVNDQMASPTYAGDLAVLLADMAQRPVEGIFHGANEGCTSRYEWAKKTLEIKGFDTKVIPVASTEFPTPALRPLYTCLNKTSLDEGGYKRLPPWEEGLQRCLKGSF